MQSPAQIEHFRRLSPGERLRLSMDLARWDLEFLDSLPPEEGRRRWELMLRQRRESSRSLEEAFRRML